MIIDCHGHYTTAPSELQIFRDAQIARLKDPGLAVPAVQVAISDDQISESLENAQPELQRQRATDLPIFSPGPWEMPPPSGDEGTSLDWTRVCNDLIHRV